jgi:hypothetical protein
VDQLLGARQIHLVLDPVVAEVELTRLLIDCGSGLNLIFASTLRKMDLDLTDMLIPSKSPFYGIIPGTGILGRPALSSSNSKLPTLNLHIMPYWADRHWPNSWQFRIMFIYFSRC